MSKLTALMQFLLALSGCSLADTTYTSRVQGEAGHLYSKARVQDGVARFECIDSSSGSCHYTLYPDACSGKADCQLAPLQRFTVARGDSRQVAGLAGFRPCVTIEATQVGPDCEALPARR